MSKVKEWETFLQMPLRDGGAFRVAFWGQDPDRQGLELVIRALELWLADVPGDRRSPEPKLKPGEKVGDWTMTHDIEDGVLFAESPGLSLKFFGGSKDLTVMPDAGSGFRVPIQILRALVEDAQKRGVW